MDWEQAKKDIEDRLYIACVHEMDTLYTDQLKESLHYINQKICEVAAIPKRVFDDPVAVNFDFMKELEAL